MIQLVVYCYIFHPQNNGYSNAFKNLIRAISDNDEEIKITVVTPTQLGVGDTEFKCKNVEVIRLSPIVKLHKSIDHIFNDYAYAKKVEKICWQKKSNMLLVETFDQVFLLSYLSQRILDQTLVRVHATNETELAFFGNGFRHLVRRLMLRNIVSKRVKWIASTNNYHIDFLKEYFYKSNQIKIAEKNFFLLPNMVSEDLHRNISIKVEGKIKIVLLGRMDYFGCNQKGFEDFIFALRILPPEVVGKLDITVVGKGDKRGQLISYCHDYENVKFVEEMVHSDVIDLLKKSDVIVLPSRYEGLSMFALEGLATGNACLFTRAGGLIDLVHENGFAVGVQNIEDLAKSIKLFTEMTPAEIEGMKLNSIKLVKNNFRPEVIARKTRLIAEIISLKQ